MPIYSRLSSPVFDLIWVDFGDKDSFVILPGGGGSAKSGVKNQIQVCKLNQKCFDRFPGIDTDFKGAMKLYSSITAFNTNGVNLICASYEKFCTIFEATKNNGCVELEPLNDFKADFGEDESSINCSHFLSRSRLATGGDDGTCRVWKIEKNETTAVVQVTKEFELRGHEGPIMAIDSHPFSPIICTGAKDGKVRLWDAVKGVPVGDYTCSMSLSTDRTPQNKGIAKLECRGCCFSLDGESVYLLQSAKKGQTELLKCALKPYTEQSDEPSSLASLTLSRGVSSGGVKLRVQPMKKVVAAAVPSTRLCISQSGKLLAVGAADGSVAVFRSDSLYKIVRYDCHDFPVTGLQFAPQSFVSASATSGEFTDILTTCSADYTIAAIHIGKNYSTVMKITFVLLSLLALMLLICITLVLFYGDIAIITTHR